MCFLAPPPYDADTASYLKLASISTGVPGIKQFQFVDNGNKAFAITGDTGAYPYTGDSVTSMDLTAPYDPTTAVNIKTEQLVTTAGIGSLLVAPDGSRVYIRQWESSLSVDKLMDFLMTTPFDISTQTGMNTAVDAHTNTAGFGALLSNLTGTSITATRNLSSQILSM